MCHSLSHFIGQNGQMTLFNYKGAEDATLPHHFGVESNGMWQTAVIGAPNVQLELSKSDLNRKVVPPDMC